MTTQNSLQLNVNSAQPVPANHFQAAPTTPENQGTNANRELNKDLKDIKQNRTSEDPNGENSNTHTTPPRRLEF